MQLSTLLHPCVTRASRLTCAALVLAALTVVQTAEAQQGAAASAARTRVPLDLTGQWVSLVTEDWQFRMLIPPVGDVGFIPVNAEGRRVTAAWDPARDEADGNACKAYAAPAIMRLPGRLRISWENDNTLRLETDTGMQNRRFHFNQAEPQGARTWQGHSVAQWRIEGVEVPGGRGGVVGRGGGSLQVAPPGYTLQVDTSHLREGYLRMNGVPYSEDAFMTEYFNLVTEEDGAQYLIVQALVADPKYLVRHYVRSMKFKKQADNAGWNPIPCAAGRWAVE